MDTSFSYEVIFLKRKLSLLLAVLMLCVSAVIPQASAANITGAGKVTTQSTSLNVRSAPSSTATIKARLKRNSYVTLISRSGSYWYVQYSSSGYGYCHSNYITEASGYVMQVKTTSGRLRVRETVYADAAIKDHLYSGTQVIVLNTNSTHAKILYNGNKIGFVYKSYLASPGSVSTKYSVIPLKVPDFKQTDSRWASVTLGSSGQTIGKIGCATTALAMTESYRTGTTIYPNAMAKKLSYTSGGAVYWPSNYNIVTSSSGYLSVIYNALKSGKPVIVGAKNSYGGQHYVVVTGVKACDTLTTSSFYINDPGSETRKTLNQFFSAYPTFYKMLYVK